MWKKMISWWRYLNRSVEKPYYFQHYTGYVGGGGGKTTHKAIYALKPLYIRLDKVCCPTYTVPH